MPSLVDVRPVGALVVALLSFTALLAGCGGSGEVFTGILEEPSVRTQRLCGLDRDGVGQEVRAVATPGPVMVGYNIFIEDPDNGYKLSRDDGYRDLVDMRADPQLFPEKIVCLIASPGTDRLECGQYELGEFDDDGVVQSTGLLVELFIDALDIEAAVYDLESEALLLTEEVTFLQEACPEDGVYSPRGPGETALNSELGGDDLAALIEELLVNS